MQLVSVAMREREWELVFAPSARMGAVERARVRATSSVRSPELRSTYWTGRPGTMS